MFIFAAPKHTAHKNGQKITYVQQKTFIDFYKRQFKTGQLKIKKIAPFWAQKRSVNLELQLSHHFLPSKNLEDYENELRASD